MQEFLGNFANWMMSDAGLLVRIAIGGCIFAALAIHDLARRGRQATRWREYAVLLAVILCAMAYGTINDLITSQISWEYFYWGKGLYETLGPRQPPYATSLARAAAMLGMKASWSAGAIIGVAMLLANNPRAGRRRLPNRRLLALLPRVVLIVIPLAAVFGLAGYAGWLTWISGDFRAIVSDNMWRPRRFMAVFGIHQGAYLGGAVGTIWLVLRITRERRLRLNSDG